MTLKSDAKFEEKITCAFKNDMKNLGNFHRLRNSDFILESKMAELNQNKNSKQPDRPDVVWKLYFTLEINNKNGNSTINRTFYTCFTESLFWRCRKSSKKAVSLGSFLQCLVHIFLRHGCFWKINWRILWNHISWRTFK